MTTPITTSTTDSQMHNNIMAAGSRDRPPMLATGRYAQWQSHVLRYTDTRPNVVPATNDTPAVPERTTIETILTMSPKNKAHYESEKEAIHLLLTGIGDEIYSTVDACKTAHEMWIAIKRLQQGESLNIQDVKTNLFWEFGKFTSHEGESMELYKPTNNNFRTSSNTKNKNVDNFPRYKNDNQTGQFRNHRTVNVAGARETVGSQVVQQTGIQCFNCKEFGHFAKECRKPKRVKDSTYHKEKMLLCKQAEKGVPLQAEQSDWLADTDEEIDEQELEAHYSYMAKIQEVPTTDSGTDSEPLEHVQYDVGYNVFCQRRHHSKRPESTSNTCLVEKDDSNVTPDSPDMCDNDIQIDQNAEDERATLANLIANLKLDVDENKKIQKQLKKENASLTQELKELVPDREETLTLEKESRSKLNKDLVRPYDYTKLNSLYEIFKPASQEYHEQLAHANEVRKKMWRKSFVKSKPNIFKNIGFLPVSKSISKSRQAYNVMTNNINHFKELVDQAWVKHSHDHFRAPTALDMEVLIKTCLMPLAIKTQNDSFTFVHELKQEMHADLKYVESLENEIDELESDKAEFSNMYDILLQECVSNDVMCSYLHSLSDLDAHNELQCLYLHKVKECECLAQKLSKQTESVSKEVYTELL
ncbi:retrovirus-related pol polyprotein from transposon TNT 1-94 [Tanacetum coccineum]